MLSMLCLVVVFGMHSLIDWTWYVPGNACVALLCAGWLAGRGNLKREDEREPAPRAEPGRERAGRPQPSRMRIALACAAVIATLLAVWTQWQPQRSEEARAQALTLLAHDPAAAVRTAEAAVSRDPLSIEALFALSSIEQAAGKPALARATLQRAVRLQPSNPQTWLTLGRYDLAHSPRSALPESAGRDLPEPGVDRARTARHPPARSGGNLQRLRDGGAGLAGARQYRDRVAVASRCLREPGSPPARRTETSPNPKSRSRALSVRPL